MIVPAVAANDVRIAAGRGVCIRRHPDRTYGKGRWRKRKGTATVRFEDGSIGGAEVHWFEAHGIGRREFKVTQVEAPQLVGATRATSQNASLQHAPSSMSVRMSASSSALTVWPVGLPASQTPFGV